MPIMFKLRPATWMIIASGIIISSLLLASIYLPSVAQAQASLGTAQQFAVLGGSTVTNTGPTIVTRSLGVSPGTAVTGFPPGSVVGGSIHAADAVASQAQSDATIAYNALAGEACNFDLTGQDLGGQTLVAGVYCFSTSAQLTGTLTLDAEGDSNARFVFQIGSTLTTASGSSVEVINGGSLCNVFWQVGSSATIGTGTQFMGNILALTSITLTTGANLEGRAIALTGAVTLDSNNVSAAQCVEASDEPTATPDAPTATPDAPTATPDAPTATPDAPTATPGAPRATPGASTATPRAPAPGTLTPTAQVPGPPIPGKPGTETPAPGMSTPTQPIDMTPAPGTPSSTPAMPGAPGTATPGTATPGTATPVRPGTTPSVSATPGTPTLPGRSTRTPTSTATAVSTVAFPGTGTGGMSAMQNDQQMSLTTLAISLATIMLLTGGLAVVVQRRRH